VLDLVTAPALDAETPSEHHGCGSRWFCAQTHPQAERWARDNLIRQGYPTFLPLITVRRRDRVTPAIWHTAQAPLWPGYVFLRFDAQRDPWQPINSTYGVRRLLGDATGPRAIPVGALEAVQALVPFAAPSTHWAPGMHCSLATGPFEGHQAVVIAIGHDMATVAILMLGHLREVALQLDCLRPRDE
jgi:transcriptional antiterminator RfaH